MSNRRSEWNAFAYKVGQHIDEYTVPQYGDMPEDQLTEYSFDDCVTQIKKYCNRTKTNARGRAETSLDMIKIAHYACAAYNKIDGG
jgi:L-lactate utilization protein LutC